MPPETEKPKLLLSMVDAEERLSLRLAQQTLIAAERTVEMLEARSQLAQRDLAAAKAEFKGVREAIWRKYELAPEESINLMTGQISRKPAPAAQPPPVT